jgi:hypothetical protein
MQRDFPRKCKEGPSQNPQEGVEPAASSNGPSTTDEVEPSSYYLIELKLKRDEFFNKNPSNIFNDYDAVEKDFEIKITFENRRNYVLKLVAEDKTFDYARNTLRFNWNNRIKNLKLQIFSWEDNCLKDLIPKYAKPKRITDMGVPGQSSSTVFATQINLFGNGLMPYMMPNAQGISNIYKI